MQRNVISRFILGFATLFLLSGCDTANPPWENLDMPSYPPKAESTALPAPSGVMPQTPVTTGSKNKVALLLPMTGRGSDAGQAMLNAAQLAMFDLGADTFELMPQDTGASPTAAREAANIALRDGAALVLGPLFAEDAKTVAPIAAQSGVNVISFSTDTSAAGPNTFILGFLPQSQVARIIDYAGQKALKRIALIAPRDAYGETVASVFDKTLRQRGLTNAGVLRYNANQPSADELRQFAATNSFDAVLIAANAAQASVISQNLPANIQRLGTGLWEQATAAQYPGLANAWYATSSPAGRKKFETHYNSTYGEMPPRLASLAYDAVALAVVLAKQGHGFGKSALLNQSGFSGVDGIFRFQPDGLNERGLAVLQITQGSAIIVQEAPSSFR